MTPEDKMLLLKDLCVRLPYAVIAHASEINKNGIITDVNISYNMVNLTVDNTNGRYELVPLFDIKPYLRPMSSMTGKEKNELKELHFYYTDAHIVNDEDNDFKPIIVDEVHCACIIDWLNKKMFDYRGLIEKNLALDCTGLHIYD